LAALVCLFSLQGCSIVEPPDPAFVELNAECHAVPGCCRDHVFVFLVNGADPVDCADLAGLRDCIQALGFIKTYYGKLCNVSYFSKEICRLHHEDPEARFVLIGYGIGADGTSRLVQRAHIDDVPIDVVITLSGHCLKSCSPAEIANVAHAINVMGSGCCHAKGADWGDSITIDSACDHDIPCHPTTRELIARELVETAQCVAVHDAEVLQGNADAARGKARGRSDEWSFLRPQPYSPSTALKRETPKPDPPPTVPQPTNDVGNSPR
jgi:hypothetical protein